MEYILEEVIRSLKEYDVFEEEDAAILQGFDLENFEKWYLEYEDYQRLTYWLLEQGFGRTAMNVAYVMLREEIDTMDRFYYYPAQDYLTELWCDECQCIVQKPSRSEIEPHIYVKTILAAIGKVWAHVQEGTDMGLYIDQVILHDALWGCFKEHFDRQVMPVMRLVFGYMDTKMSQAVRNGWQPDRPYKEQSDQYHLAYEKCFDDFNQWIEEVCSTRLPEGMLRQKTLSEGYLKATLERVIWGHWRKEDDAI